MQPFLAIDADLFRLINQKLANSFFDWLMPTLSWHWLFIPAAIVAASWLIVRGGARGRLCVAFILLSLVIGDTVICSSLKKVIGRPRPFEPIPETRILAGRGRSFSMPSGHATNWAAGVAVCFAFYRRSIWVGAPMAVAVGVSRIYNGVHYPSDVVAGLALGAFCAIAIIWAADKLWQTAGQFWFPFWRRQLPRLVPDDSPLGRSIRGLSGASVVGPDPWQDERPVAALAAVPGPAASVAPADHWLRLGYVCIGALLAARLLYLAADRIELSEDEAYQWLWSKHLALSYYSKPPLIAYTQYLGTHLWGDTEFGVRFFSPVLAALVALRLLRFFAREYSAQAGFWLLMVLTAAPLTAVGSVLMTVDPLLVAFWTLAMFAGWQAIQHNRPGHWTMVGLWLGLASLSKYTALLQWLSWALYFWLWPPARRQLRGAGPYLALGINLLFFIPVLIWNSQHDWVTVQHVATNASLDKTWILTYKYFWDFIVAEFALLNPVFFVGAMTALIGIWRRRPSGPAIPARDPLGVFFFCLGAPVFLGYLAYTVRSRVHPNWIAPAIVPLFALMMVYWYPRWQETRGWISRWFTAGIAFGLGLVVLLHDTNLITKIIKSPLPITLDPARRVRGWRDTADVVGKARAELLREGKPVFLIGAHYGITSLLSFYLPEAKAAVSGTPLVYVESSETPKNQFYFWPDYRTSFRGANAIFVQETDRVRPAPKRLLNEFESVTDRGLRPVRVAKRTLRTVQIFECRGLR